MLIADDDAAARTVARGLLAVIEAGIIEAGDGREALALLTERPGDLLLAEWRKPGADRRQLPASAPPGSPGVIIGGVGVEPLPRAAAVRQKDELSPDRLAFAIRRIGQDLR